MADRLTDRQKKKIIVDYLETESYNATAKKNNTTHQTVKRIVTASPEVSRMLQQKKEKNTADILAYMESQKDAICEIIRIGLEVLPGKIENAKTASEVTTALGTLIDKWTPKGQFINGKDWMNDDPITKSLKEEIKNGTI